MCERGDAKESEEEVKNTREESAKEAKEEGKNIGEEGAQEAKEDVPNTGEERAHLTGEELQETEEEARLTRKAFLMSLHFAWFPGVTQTHRRPCWVHRETNEVVLQKPTDDQLEKQTGQVGARYGLESKLIGSLRPCFGTVICVRKGCQNHRNSESGWT